MLYEVITVAFPVHQCAFRFRLEFLDGDFPVPVQIDLAFRQTATACFQVGTHGVLALGASGSIFRHGQVCCGLGVSRA